MAQVNGFKQQWAVLQPMGPQISESGCKRKDIGDGQLKVAQEPGVVVGTGVVVGFKQQWLDSQPMGPHTRLCGCNRRLIGGGQLKEAQVPGVVVWRWQHFC